jgi:hypothetical protein
MRRPLAAWVRACLLAGCGASLVASPRAPVAGRGARASCLMSGATSDGSIRLTGDLLADRMILEKAGAAGKIGREDMVAGKGRSLADVALGSTAEWKRAVHKARSDAVTAVRVRHILVQTQQLAETLRSELRDGARFDELAPAVSSCAVTRDKGGEVGWSGINDEHLDPILPPPVRLAAMAVKPGDVTVAESILGWHVLQVVDVFQTLMIDSNPRTRALPGSGVLPQPLIQLLRSSRNDDRGFKQLLAEGEANQGAGQLMHNSGKTGRHTTMKYSMDSMGCALAGAYFEGDWPAPIFGATGRRIF